MPSDRRREQQRVKVQAQHRCLKYAGPAIGAALMMKVQTAARSGHVRQETYQQEAGSKVTGEPQAKRIVRCIFGSLTSDSTVEC